MLNVSFEPLFSVGIGNLPVTYGADDEREGCPLTRYRMPNRLSIRQVINYDARRAGEPVLKKRKHIREFTKPTTSANWGLPKSERL